MSGFDLTTQWHLCSNLPGVSTEVCRRWLGSRIFWIPTRLKGFQCVTIASSRLPKRLDKEAHWFRYLRAAFQSCQGTSTLIPVISSAAGSEFVARACELFGFRKLQIRLPADDGFADRFLSPADEARWSDFCMNCVSTTSVTASDRFTIFVSPEHSPGTLDSCSESLKSLPLADRLLFTLAQRICIPSIRSGGTISRLVAEHLSDTARASVPLLIAADPNGNFPRFLTSIEGPWIPWRILQPKATVSIPSLSQDETSPGDDPYSGVLGPTSIVPLPINNPLSRPDHWLCHWTRSATGPWPGESRQDYIDQLILDDAPVDRSARSTLLRILSEKRVRGSTLAIRGGYEVSAFTEVPLAEFRSRRIFRSHRQRYDFEPWGIAIRRDVFQLQGGRKVQYGTEDLWKHLSDSERPFFQKNTPDGVIDTLSECEWRMLGDFALESLPANSVCAFVPTVEDVWQLQPACDWPICVVPDGTVQTSGCVYNNPMKS